MEVINIDSSDDEGGAPAGTSGSRLAARVTQTQTQTQDANPPSSDDSSVSSADSIWDKPGLKPKANKGEVVLPLKSNVPLDSEGEEELEIVGSERGERGGMHQHNNGGSIPGSENSRGGSSVAQPAAVGGDRAMANPAPTCDAWIGTWRIVLLADVREFGQHKGSDFLQKTQAKINKNFGENVCELVSLPSADYMFVARLVSNTSGEVIDERVLDLIIERKHVSDLATCLTNDSKKYKPLKFFEAQMYKMQCSGVSKKLFLMEGDEDNKKDFAMLSAKPGYGAKKAGFGAAPQMEQMKRLKRVKTVRLQISKGEWQGVDCISTKTREDTVEFLIQQLAGFKKSFDPLRPPAMTMDDLKKQINDAMSAPTFREYLRQISIKGVGPARAMKVIKDPKLDWDKTFMAPSCVLRKTKSTLEDRATFWGESAAEARDRNLANARAFAMRSQTSGGVYACISEMDKNVDSPCGLCRKPIDIFEETGHVSCNRVAKCGKVFHESCLADHEFDIGLSDGCILCRGLSNFSVQSRGNLVGTAPFAATAKSKRTPRVSESPKISSTKKASAPAAKATKARTGDRPGETRQAAKSSTASSKKGSSGTKKRKRQDEDEQQPTPQKLYVRRSKISHQQQNATIARTSVIDRNGFPSNPLHDADKYAATARLLGEEIRADIGRGAGSAKKKKTSSDGSRRSSSTATTDECEKLSCGVCNKAIDIWADEQDIIPCNRTVSCGATFHQACLATKQYDIQTHDGCIKCEARELFSVRRAKGLGKTKADDDDDDDVIIVDSDDEDGVIVID